MGIVSSQGSLKQISNQPEDSNLDIKIAPEKITTLIDSNQYKLPTDGVHASDHIYTNIVSHQTVYNTDRIIDDPILRNLLQYNNGHIVPVIYFSQINPSLLGKMNPTDISTGETHNSHTSYLKIINFELALEGPLEFSYIEEDGYMSVNGSATIHPGFIPKKGDIFYYLLNDGQWGIMVIRSIQRLSISSVTRYYVSFELQELLTPSRQEYIESQVKDTAYFDKLMYFNQPYTLLEHDKYIIFKDLLEMRNAITQYYHDKFYNPIIGSYIHPGSNGYYDPYLVEYLQNKLSIVNNKNIRRPKQLYSRMTDYTQSIWCKLSGANISITTDVYCFYSLERFIPHFWNSDITSLAGKYYLKLERDNPNPNTPIHGTDLVYASLSYGFYLNDRTSMNDYENMLFSMIIGDKVNPIDIYKYIEKYNTWELEYGFYHIPIAMYLLDKAIFILKD